METVHSLEVESQAFLQFLDSWLVELPALSLPAAAPRPERVAIVSVDVIEGFCSQGTLASARVGGIVEPIARLLRSAWNAGVHSIALVQDTHEPDAVEFGAWPVHCVRGSDESQSVAALRELPFYSQLSIFPKNSISSFMNTGLSAWIAGRPALDTFIVVGDCTDLCTYQLAMHLRLDANARQVPRRVIVPADCTDTYDWAVTAAQKEGGLPHDAALLHAVFLYHMALNGVEVVSSII